jgi:hypothetical protein
MHRPFVLTAIMCAFVLFSASAAEAQPCPKNTPRDKQGRPLNKNCVQQRPDSVFFPGFGGFGGGGGSGLSPSGPGSARHGTLGGGAKSGGSSGGMSSSGGGGMRR